MKNRLVSSLACLSLLAAGCASMSGRQCRATDWLALGERDGLSGGPARVDVYQHQCRVHNVAIDEKQYMDGWWLGHAEFERRTGGQDSAD